VTNVGEKEKFTILFAMFAMVPRYGKNEKFERIGSSRNGYLHIVY
jgi:hypothetical protein